MMMCEVHERKNQEKTSLWRSLFAMVSGADIDWKEAMPLPMIDNITATKKATQRLTKEEIERIDKLYRQTL